MTHGALASTDNRKWRMRGQTNKGANERQGCMNEGKVSMRNETVEWHEQGCRIKRTRGQNHMNERAVSTMNERRYHMNKRTVLTTEFMIDTIPWVQKILTCLNVAHPGGGEHTNRWVRNLLRRVDKTAGKWTLAHPLYLSENAATSWRCRMMTIITEDANECENNNLPALSSTNSGKREGNMFTWTRRWENTK